MPDEDNNFSGSLVWILENDDAKCNPRIWFLSIERNSGNTIKQSNQGPRVTQDHFYFNYFAKIYA